jgi:hypothetical protein
MESASRSGKVRQPPPAAVFRLHYVASPAAACSSPWAALGDHSTWLSIRYVTSNDTAAQPASQVTDYMPLSSTKSSTPGPADHCQPQRAADKSRPCKYTTLLRQTPRVNWVHCRTPQCSPSSPHSTSQPPSPSHCMYKYLTGTSAHHDGIVSTTPPSTVKWPPVSPSNSP